MTQESFGADVASGLSGGIVQGAGLVLVIAMVFVLFNLFRRKKEREVKGVTDMPRKQE